MKPELKRDLIKIFHVASFLFITIFFVLPYLVQTSTYFHEKAHMKALDKNSIKNSYRVNLLDTIPNFFNPKVNKLGVTRFDLEDYKKLNKYRRAEINIAGIVSDLRFLFLIGVYLAVVNVYLFYKIKFKKDENINRVLAINWVLFIWLLALVQITIANITNSAGDVYHLINLMRV